MSVWASVLLVAVGAAISLVTDALRTRAAHRYELTTRWDEERLSTAASYSSALGSVLRSADKATAHARRAEAGPLFEKLVLLMSPEVVSAADSARRSVGDYIQRLPVEAHAADDGVDLTRSGTAFLSDGRPVLLDATSSTAQAKAYDALGAFAESVRRELRVAPLGHALAPHPSAAESGQQRRPGT